MSLSDYEKRKELFLEFLYYIFDSLLIPLIRSNFHVTESNLHRNRLFFFRHDVWCRLTESSLSTLKLSMFDEIKTVQAKKLLAARVLGFSQIRLLPKSSGVRPIMNLRRRITKLRDGKVVLGKSINSVMAPVFNMLMYEQKKQPHRSGSALFSVGDMYPRLKAFRNHLRSTNAFPEKFYFVKGDVQSCFDTIPQQGVIKLMEDIVSEEEYKITHHAEIKSSKMHGYNAKAAKGLMPNRKFVATARATSDFQTFQQVIESGFATGKKNTVFVDAIVHATRSKDTLVDLLKEHVQRNVVKSGKKFFRQKAGIPQGSILSSLLCNYFYAELEREYLGFLNQDESILLRLIDDFLLITSNEDHAKRFFAIMHDGVDKYGVKANITKSLVNFELCVNGRQVPRLLEGIAFPYCGNMINTVTLEITKDIDRRKNAGAIT